MEVSPAIEEEIRTALKPISISSIGIVEMTDLNIPVVVVYTDTDTKTIEETMEKNSNGTLESLSSRISKPIVIVNGGSDDV